MRSFATDSDFTRELDWAARLPSAQRVSSRDARECLALRPAI